MGEGHSLFLSSTFLGVAAQATGDQRQYNQMPNKAMQPMTALRRLAVVRESVVGQSWLILGVLLFVHTIASNMLSSFFAE
jgi:hypothetical protein